MKDKLKKLAASGIGLGLGLCALAAHADSILFIGNSFTFGERTAVQFYHPEYVRDLNQEGKGGVPALFKSFTRQAGLDYDVSMETHPGVGLDWHLANRSSMLAQRPYDHVVMHGYSTLDAKKPGDPTTLVATTKDMTALLKSVNPKVDVRLVATWSRPDQTYPETGAWRGKTIDVMAKDVRAGYDQAAAGTRDVRGVIPVGEAFNRAIQAGLADDNPYDGIDAGKFNLWTYDNYHASAFGYYLEALLDFGSITTRDPRSLGESECSAFELGLSPEQAKALQQVAFDQLVANKTPVTAAPNLAHDAAGPVRCGALR
jgi:hypothetical protein